MQNLRCENTFNGMANGVTEVKKVSETALSFVFGDNFGLESSGGENRGLESFLYPCKSGLLRGILGLYGGQDGFCVVFESGKGLFA